jgi:hypothetical protein
MQRRFSIAALMGVVLVVSLAAAALRARSELAADWAVLATLGALALAGVGAVVGRGPERAARLGFLAFGAAVLLFSSCPNHSLLDSSIFSLGAVVASTGSALAVKPAQLCGFPCGIAGFEPATKVFHCIFALAAATCGGALARWLVPGAAREEDAALAASARAADVSPRGSWKRPAAIALAAYAAFAGLAIAARMEAPAFAASLTSLTACGVVALSIVGAVTSTGRRRAVWLGAALFGGGYFALASGSDGVCYDPCSARPFWTADELAGQVVARLPQVQPGGWRSRWDVAAANARIERALERPVALSFPSETALSDVLNSIKSSTHEPDGWETPIYVDPVGLLEAEKTMSSPVTFDVQGVPLSRTLPHLLRQIGLKYEVRDGMLCVTSPHVVDSDSSTDGPDLWLAHGLLSLAFAGVGAAAARVAFGRPGGSGPE